ncbi:MAG: hypothetical protein Q3971_02040 [Moraxella sp.]|nr:hypothetical protein [Moraxella sp.]
MKNHIKFVFGLSLMALALALAGCDKKEKTQESAKPSADVARPVVSERPQVVCDDVGTKNRVVALIQDGLLKSSLDALGNAKTPALEQHLKSRLAQTQIDVQNIRYDNGECQGELHISLDPKDVATANKAFADARVASLDERAVENGVSLLGGHRLVANFVYQVDGEALAINTSNPAISVASKALAQASIATVRQDRATARRDSGSSYQAPNIAPPPTVRPAPTPRPAEPQQQAQQAQPQPRRTPTPETAVLRPEDVPSRERETAPTPSSSATASSEPPITAKERAEIQTQTQAQPKPEPKAETKAPATPSGGEITIVESNETY